MAKTQTASQTQQPKAAVQQQQQNKPIHEIRLSRIKASIWENATDNGVRYNVTIARIYKDDSGWHQTENFGRDDLPILAEISRQTWLWIFQKQQEPE